MKKLSSNTMKVEYKNTCDENIHIPLSWKQKWLPCGTFTRRMYIMAMLVGVVMMWIIIYYKILHHHFELPEPLRELRKMFGDGDVKKRRGREEETENITPVTRNTCLSQFQIDRRPEVVHFAIVACEDRHEDALVSMKSIALVSNSNIYFHIFTDKRRIREETFEKVLKTWPSWTQHWMMFTIHPINYPVNEDKKDWFSHFKPCATQSLFLARILNNVDALIYVDTDVVFLEAPENLWKTFEKFDDSHIAALALECGNKENCHYSSGLPYPYYKPYGLNSGMMLMNLTRMRSLRWEVKLVEIFSKYKNNLAYGDQSILNIYFENNRKTLFELDCSWNYRPHFCATGNLCKKAEQKGISAIHGSGEVFQQNNIPYEFSVVNEAFRNYKFKGKFEEEILNFTRDKLSSRDDGDANSCSQMRNAMLKHITCPN